MGKNLIVSAITFVLGGVFVMSDQAGITANVIGYSGVDAGFTSVMGIALIIASAAFFIFTLENQIQHERHVRMKNDHDAQAENAVYQNELSQKAHQEKVES